MAGKSISETFAAVPASALAVILDDIGLAPGAPVADLLSLGVATSDVLVEIANYVISNAQEWRLQQIAPILQGKSHTPLPLDVLSTRPANGLQRSGISTWQNLVNLTPAELLELPSIGHKSVAEIIALALSRAAVQVLLGADVNETPSSAATRATGEGREHGDPDKAPSELNGPNILSDAAIPNLQTAARWAVCIGNAETIGAALELVESRIPPDDVAEAINALRQIPLPLNSDTKPQIARAYGFLWEACGDERRQEIFRQRISFQPPTLDELGPKMMLTPERIRQLQKAAQDSVSAALLRSECAEIRWRAIQLRQELGTAISWSNVATRDALNKACRDIGDDSATAESILLWLAGPYRLDKRTGWIFAEKEYFRSEVGPRSEIGPPPRISLLQALSDEGVVNIMVAKAHASAAGLVPAAIDDWIELCPFRDIDGKLILWHGNVADKAAVLLGILKRPATAEELNGLIAEGHSIRSLRDRLLGDERFIRTDRSRVGLRQWGLEEYSGIVDEIEEEIARRGGDADVHDLVQTITKQFNLRSSSVASYTTVPRFVVETDRIHVRQADEPFTPARTLFDEGRAFLLDENLCSYRVRVDDDVLRGSGRPLPQGIGAWLGVLPGMRREFRFQDDDILLISWPDSALLGPALGSLRRQALARSARSGDALLLEFDRSSDEVEILHISQLELEAAKGWLRGTLLTGIDASNQDEFERLLAKAIGVSSAADLWRKCRDRGDLELSELVHRESSDLDEALERLKGLL
jgi:hypothetical protein